MTLTPIAPRSPEAVRDALVRRGMEESRANGAALGLRSVTVLFDSLSEDDRITLTQCALQNGVDCVSGQNWALLSGSKNRIAGLARPKASPLPPALAIELGTYLGTLGNPTDGWLTARGVVHLSGPMVVGILNVTPDSFSDGGKFFDPEAALAHAEALLEAGASILDIGAESTRPGQTEPVTVNEEWRRLEPVLKQLVLDHPDIPISVDTVKSTIAERALTEGAWAINDVSGLRFDNEMAAVCAKYGAGLILMHSRGPFSELASYEHATYDDVAVETANELLDAVDRAETDGLARERIVLDPGLGFAKTPEQNCQLLKDLSLLTSLGFPVLVGPSRKRFLGELSGKDVLERDAATAAACVAAYLEGAMLFRVHAVDVVKEALYVAAAVGSR